MSTPQTRTETESRKKRTKAMGKYEDAIEIVDDDHRILTSHMQDADGNWRQFLMGHYRRKK